MDKFNEKEKDIIESLTDKEPFYIEKKTTFKIDQERERRLYRRRIRNEKIVELKKAGKTLSKIAEELKVSRETVKLVIRKAGAKTRKYYDKYYNEWKTLYEAGEGLECIAKKYGTSGNNVSKALNNLNVKFRSPGTPGHMNKESVYSEYWEEWKRLYLEEGLSPSAIAKKYNMKYPQPVFYILFNKFGLERRK